jgi:hypothetical protein
MRKHWWLVLGLAVIAGSTRWAMSGHAFSVEVDATQPVDVEGRVGRFTLSSGGLLDGFLLEDSTEVHVASYLAKQLGHAVQRGESVRVHGLRVPGVRMVVASSVTALNTGETVVDKGEVGLEAPISGTGTPDTSEEGTVTQLLHGQSGQLNGVLFDSGVIARLPPGVPVTRPELFVVGQQISLIGDEFSTQYGTVVRIDSMGVSDNELSPVRQPGLELPAPTP